MSSRLMRLSLEVVPLELPTLYALTMPTFDRENHHKITEFIEKYELKKGQRKVAVFDADGTLWRGDIGESFFEYEIKKKLLTPKKIGMPEGTNLWDVYWNEVLNGNPAKAYGWMAEWHAGIAEEDLNRWCNEFVAQHFQKKAFESMRTLTHSLMNAGFEVWVVSASIQWIVLAGIQGFGIQPDHVIGTKVKVENGILTNTLVEPLPYRAGKVESIEKNIGERPLFVAGNTIWDADMLSRATEIALTVHSEDAESVNYPSEEKLQKMFTQKQAALKEALKKGLNEGAIWLSQKF